MFLIENEGKDDGVSDVLRANVKATQIKATVSISKRQNRFLL